MNEGMRLDGSMIPRRIKRMFDQRAEPRAAGRQSGLLGWDGRTLVVPVLNLSASGAMVLCGEIPHIGDAVVLTMPDRAPCAGAVAWVRDGRIGIHFTAAVE